MTPDAAARRWATTGGGAVGRRWTWALADAQEMMADARYGNDQAFTRKVEQIIYEMHGEQLPA